MSIYEEFMVILTVALLIVAILNLKNKKKPSHSPSDFLVKHILHEICKIVRDKSA